MAPDRSLKVMVAAIAIGSCALALLAPFTVLCACGLVAIAAVVAIRMLPRTLLCEPIQLSPNAVLEHRFEVKVAETYELWLEFERNGHTEEELRSLIGLASIR